MHTASGALCVSTDQRLFIESAGRSGSKDVYRYTSVNSVLLQRVLIKKNFTGVRDSSSETVLLSCVVLWMPYVAYFVRTDKVNVQTELNQML